VKLVVVDYGQSHLIDPKTVDGFACNAGRGGNRRRVGRSVIEREGITPTCRRCLGMLRQGTHPNLTGQGR
jgi:hypothetical protein